MSLNFDIFSFLVLLGACQGLILSLYLFLSKEAAIKGKNYLGFFMLILAYNGFETFSWSSGIDAPYFRLFFECFSFILIFGLGPSLYLYVKSLTNQESGSSKRVFVHFIPLILRAFARAIIVIYALFWNNGVGFKNLTPMDLDWRDVRIAEPLSVLVFCLYLLFAFKELSKFNKNPLFVPISDKVQGDITSRWIKIFLRCMAVFAVIWMVTLFSPIVFEIEYGPHFYAIEVLLVFFIYWIAFASYYRTRVVYVQPQKLTATCLSSISAEEMAHYTTSIENAMKVNKLYLDATLTVRKLAEHLQLNPKIISAVLNGHLNKSFNEFVNNYRIGEVKERLLDPKKGHLTITGIAMEAGFNSQATFQRSFKNCTGMSPREFLASKIQKTA